MFYTNMNLIFHFLLICTASRVKSENAVNEEAKVDWTNSTMPSTEQDTHPSLPDEVELSLSIFNETVHLILTKKQNDDFEEVPVIVGTEKDVKLWHHSADEAFSTYSDTSKDASFTVVVNTEGNGTIVTEYRGSFVHNGTKYTLIPEKYHEQSKIATDVMHKFTLNGTQYVVYEDSKEQIGKDKIETVNDILGEKNDEETGDSEEAPADQSNQSDDIEVVEEIPEKISKILEVTMPPEIKSNQSDFEQKRSSREKRSSKKKLVGELYVVIDYSMYTRWLKLNDMDKDKTIERIRYYLAYVINGVNNVYTSLRKIRISFKVINIFVAETKSLSEFSENSPGNLGGNKINFGLTLDAFKKWLEERTPDEGEMPSKEKFVPKHDIAIVFTDYNNPPVEGIAGLGAVCSNNSQAVVHSTYQFSTITTTAHEIGHLLGSDHDGADNECDPENQYVMTDETDDNKEIRNRHKFSTCSESQILQTISKLEGTTKNCLASSTKQKQSSELAKLLDSHPGVHFGPDMQCKLKFGDGYTFCSNGRNTYQNMCERISCYNIKDKKCYSKPAQPRALNGTSCDKGKWCMNGKCVSGAPTKEDEKENCYFGDATNGVIFNENPMLCEDFLESNNNNLCYSFEEECCATCEQIKSQKNIQLENCAYGDRGVVVKTDDKTYGCEIVFNHSGYCKNEQYLENCCESCIKAKKKFEQTEQEAEQTEGCREAERVIYNGQIITCKSVSNPSNCYALEKACCQTCTEIKNRLGISIKDCPYGDRGVIFEGTTDGCGLVLKEPHQCENDVVKRSCCESCNKAKKIESATTSRTKPPKKTKRIRKDSSCKDTDLVEFSFTCKQLLISPSYCYQLKKKCCETCEQVKTIKEAKLGSGCPYGDRDFNFNIDGKRYKCSDAAWKNEICDEYGVHCCESCHDIKRR